MRTFHVLSLPWTHTTDEYLACAYTQKVVKFCRMFEHGAKTILYSNEFNDAPANEHVPIFSAETRDALFGPYDRNDAWSIATWDDNDSAWQAWNRKAAEEVAKRAEPGDFLCMTAPCHGVVAARNPHLVAVEPFVGYERFDAQWPHFFESYAWMHHVYGQNRISDGRPQDAVVPNYFDPADFEIGEPTNNLLYLGRVIERKGVMDAVTWAEVMGLNLIVAGPGRMPEIEQNEYVTCIGAVGAEERRTLLREARAVLMPTRYIEPFGGVAVEAMLSGRPVITTDFGAFTETVEEGVTGFRVRNLSDAVSALNKTGTFDSERCRARAIERFSIEAVRPMFERAFDRSLRPRTLRHADRGNLQPTAMDGNRPG